MKHFVNREAEMIFIEDALSVLSDPQRLLRTPIIEFYGLQGIGKTTLMQEVKDKCVSKQLPYRWVNVHQQKPILLPEEVQELKAASYESPTVLLFDVLDIVNDEELNELQTLLNDLTEHGKLCIILASRKMLTFETMRTLARKLTCLELQALSQESCTLYLKEVAPDLDPPVRDLIFEWTQGYPLAMNVMVSAIREKRLDPRNTQHHNELLRTINEKVIQKGILSKVSDQPKYQTILSIISVPRRFNLTIMQKLIEKYAGYYALRSSLAYMALPNIINETTDILSWNLARGGFTVSPPARNIFLLKSKIKEPAVFLGIHKFLAEINRSFATEVSGSDRVRYLIEYFYHILNSEEEGNNTHIFQNDVLQLLKEEPLEAFQQFSTECQQDTELQAKLGKHASTILTFIESTIAEMNSRSER